MTAPNLGNALMRSIFCMIALIAGPAFGDSVSLFDGTDLNSWEQMDGAPAKWIQNDSTFEVVPGSGDLRTKQSFQDFRLHVEFWIPYLPDRHGQDRGNSGVFLLNRYEIQILDSVDNPTYANGTCGSLYLQIAPAFSAALGPEAWQSFDIDFRAPRVNLTGAVVQDGMLSVDLNGQTVIDAAKVTVPTGSRAKLKQGLPGPIVLQDHGSRVRFRNIWIETR